MHGIGLLQQWHDEQQRGRVDHVGGCVETGAQKHHVATMAQRAARRRQDPRLPHQVLELDRLAGQQRVAGAHDRADRFLDQFFVHEIGIVVIVENAPDREIERTALQAFEQDVARLDMGGDVQQRCALLDARDRHRQQGHRRRHDHADIDLAGQADLERDHVVVRERQAGERHARVPDHRLAVDGRLHAARQALEQLHVEHVLEVLELLGCSRLRHVQHLGCTMDIAVVVDRDQQQQLPRFQAGPQKPVRIERRVHHGNDIIHNIKNAQSAKFLISP